MYFGYLLRIQPAIIDAKTPKRITRAPSNAISALLNPTGAKS
jgi:hypothetical protein